MGALCAAFVMIPIAAYVAAETLWSPRAPRAIPPAAASQGAPSPAPARVSSARAAFKADIRPIIAAHCATCHVQQRLGGLDLGSYQGLMAGGNVVPGPVVTAGGHAHSTLWRIVRPAGTWPGGYRMPLGGPYLSDDQVHTIAAWIDQGAKDN